MTLTGARIHITGIVQGVGFRPFVYGLGTHLALTGWVRNTSAGVELEIDGNPETLQVFIQGLQHEAPPLARIDQIEVEWRSPTGFTGFEIIHSEAIPGAFQPISPDVSICTDCLRELFDPDDRRYRYPFINCTNCGPRFTIITDIPYDRPNTTMADFTLCSDCAVEYHNPLDRRFHAQPVACPVCGPQVWLEESKLKPTARRESLTPGSRGDEAIQAAQRLLTEGKIVAVKGLGGFHLACDATNQEAVAELRQRKLRVDKPFALMMAGLVEIKAHCWVNEAERNLLLARERPIVILRRKPGTCIAAEVAPNQDTLGVMLPYTPLHYLLLAADPHQPDGNRPPQALVMTSGNLSEEPIAMENEEARKRLSALADAFLMHDRPIRTRCDDSVVRVIWGKVIRNKEIRDKVSSDQAIGGQAIADQAIREAVTYPLRRSRGYAPFPVQLPWEAPPLLATGAELKNTFCLTRERYAFLSHHIGDLENFETLQSFEDGVAHFERLFHLQTEALAYDLHPNYLSTRYALERSRQAGLPAIGVQHHHAHIAACMAEHQLSGDQPVIGVAFDGTGYGDDGAIWGGEFLLADYSGYRRFAHLAYVPLPGGDKAVREPWRIALAWLAQAGQDWNAKLPPLRYLAGNQPANQGDTLAVLRRQLETRLNAPATSSMGRLFDAAAALAGVRQTVNYEAQAAIELEARVDPAEKGDYPFVVKTEEGQKGPEQEPMSIQPAKVVDPAPLIQSITNDQLSGVPIPIIAARFHNSVAAMVCQVAKEMRATFNVNEIVLSGGVWQNLTLLGKTVRLLEKEKFSLFIHQQVPPNDGGLALGQAVVAVRRLSD